MRPIKFRAWDRAVKKFFYWMSKDHDFFGPSMLLTNPDHREDFQQFTGLFDKNRREIFEGDILECSGRSVVIFDLGSFYMKAISPNSFSRDPGAHFPHKNYILLGQYGSYGWGIIGNIHENPELLK